MKYPKRFMCLSELVDYGLPRKSLDKWKLMQGFPRIETPGRKILVDTSQLDIWLDNYSKKERMRRGIRLK